MRIGWQEWMLRHDLAKRLPRGRVGPVTPK
jgi:hypothetical protein